MINACWVQLPLSSMSQLFEDCMQQPTINVMNADIYMDDLLFWV